MKLRTFLWLYTDLVDRQSFPAGPEAIDLARDLYRKLPDVVPLEEFEVPVDFYIGESGLPSADTRPEIKIIGGFIVYVGGGLGQACALLMALVVSCRFAFLMLLPCYCPREHLSSPHSCRVYCKPHPPNVRDRYLTKYAWTPTHLDSSTGRGKAKPHVPGSTQVGGGGKGGGKSSGAASRAARAAAAATVAAPSGSNPSSGAAGGAAAGSGGGSAGGGGGGASEGDANCYVKVGGLLPGGAVAAEMVPAAGSAVKPPAPPQRKRKASVLALEAAAGAAAKPGGSGGSGGSGGQQRKQLSGDVAMKLSESTLSEEGAVRLGAVGGGAAAHMQLGGGGGGMAAPTASATGGAARSPLGADGSSGGIVGGPHGHGHGHMHPGGHPGSYPYPHPYPHARAHSPVDAELLWQTAMEGFSGSPARKGES